MITLAAGALGLVCALAWNDAIKSAMKSVLGEDDSLAGLFYIRYTRYADRRICFACPGPGRCENRRRSNDFS